MKRILVLVFGILVVGSLFAAQDVRFAIIGDRTGSNVRGVYEDVLNEVTLFCPEMAITVGDQIQGYTDDLTILNQQWAEYKGLIASLSFPLYLIPGNHDILSEEMEKVYTDQTKLSPCYSFDYQGIHFSIMDTGRWESSQEWLDKSGYRDWLEKDLAQHKKDRLTIVIYHKPFWYDTLANGETDPLHEVFKANGVDAVFNGHYHVYSHAVYDGIDYTVVGSSGGAIDKINPEQGAFFQYLICNVKENKLSWVVLPRGSAKTKDFVTVADAKFFEKVESQYIKMDSMRFAEGMMGKSVDLGLKIVSNQDKVAGTASWEVPANWEMTPKMENYSIEGKDVTKELVFTARQTGSYFPLPVCHITYPYGNGKEYTSEKNLPFLRSVKVRRIPQPRFDGGFEAKMWQAAGKIDAFGIAGRGMTRVEPTTLYLGYDDKNLYMAAVCTQSKDNPLVTKAKERDSAVNLDDMFGMFLSPDGEGKQLYQIYFNAAGVIYDAHYQDEKLGKSEEIKWNGDITVVRKDTPEGWVLEIAIPFSELKMNTPVPGDTLRANFRRKEQAVNCMADWQVPLDFDPAHYGFLEFE